MAQNDYKPVSWNGEPITNAKLNQMSNNTQFLFERTPRIRYQSPLVTRDSAVKLLTGKTPFPIQTGANYRYVNIYFGSFFSSGCAPVVTATVEASNHRAKVVTRSLAGQGIEIDQTGFLAIVSHEENILGGAAVLQPGWVHWIAVGY